MSFKLQNTQKGKRPEPKKLDLRKLVVNVLAGLVVVASVSLIVLSFGTATAPMLALGVECSIYYSLSEFYDSKMPTLRGAA